MRWSNAMLVAVGAAVAVGACDTNKSQPGAADAGSSGSVAAAGRAGYAGDLASADGGVGGSSMAEVRQAPMPVAVTMTPDAMPASPNVQGIVTSPDAATAMIIRTGTASIKVDSLEPAVARIRTLAQALGGFVGNTSMQTGKDQLRSAMIEVKVPAERWPQLLTGLKPIGTLESQDESAQDVGEEFVDVQARVANSRRLEERLIALLANRTGKLQDALQVERELARVREEIDRYEGRIRYLRTRTAVSTMVITVHEPAPVLGARPGQNPIADAFRNAWQIFVGLVALLISSMGVLIPVGLVVWLVWRRKNRPVR